MAENDGRLTIVHVCLTGPFSDGFSYQDNLLSKYHARMGMRVVLIAPTWAWDRSGKMIHVSTVKYMNEDSVEVARIENDQNKPVSYRFKTYRELGRLLEEVGPDIVFLHGCQMRDSRTVAGFIRSHPRTKLFVDNHADYSNSATGWLSKNVLHRVVWRHYAKLLEPYVETFWGVLPARVDFMVENYGLPAEKCKLLVMGADDDEIARASNSAVRAATRCGLGVGDGDFLVVTGGKIDQAKRQTVDFMRAFAADEDSRLRLLVFGPIATELQSEASRCIDGEKVQHVGWADTSTSYDYFSAADLVIFPGRHSVYWEEAVGLGKPMVVKRWDGTDHVKRDGNAVLVDSDDPAAFMNEVAAIKGDEELYASMYSAAHLAASGFRYSAIAEASIGRGGDGRP